MSFNRLFLGVMVFGLVASRNCFAQQLGEGMKESFYEYVINTLQGKQLDLAEFRGKVLLVVNTASKCGLTPQYAGLENLQTRYSASGFSVLGFPSNDFGAQEPGSAEEIAEFCEINFGVSFPMMEKNPVKGEDKQPVYKYLTELSKPQGPEGEITWNFEKFLIDKNGVARFRFSPRTAPESEEVTAAIETLVSE
jgi:glutathione peroxidase